MPEAQGYTNPFYFDCTKAWKHDEFPLIELGIIECNANPVDHFSEVEQVAFSPANVVPGIGYSPDKLLQGRLLVYDDAQHHRLGPNFKLLPVNCPFATNNHYNVGGNHNIQTMNKFPHYAHSMFGGPQANPAYLEPPMRCDGPADYYDMPGEGTDADYYAQAREFLRVMEKTEYDSMCFNLAVVLGKCEPSVTGLMLSHFDKINPELGAVVRGLIDSRAKGVGMTETEKMFASLYPNLKQGMSL